MMGDDERGDILHSWKDISAYLGKDIRTCYRWAKYLSLPVHRVNRDSSRSKVFAYKSELDAWFRERPTHALDLEKRTGLRRRRTAIGFTGFFCCAALGVLYFTGNLPINSRKLFPSIAVAPFQNLDPGAQNEYFSEGITSEVVNRLSLEGRVSILPAKKLSEIEQSLNDPDIIRSQIGADYLLRGKVKKDEKAVHVAVEVIRIRDAARVLNLQFDEGLDNISYVIDSLRLKIAELLGTADYSADIPLSPRARNSAPAFPSYDNVLKGKYLLNRVQGESPNNPRRIYYQGRYFSGLDSREANELAITLFQEALDLNPNFPEGYIGLARCYTNYVNFGWDDQKKWLDMAESLLQKAQELSPGLPDYYSNLVLVLLLKDACFSESRKTEAYALAEEGIRKYQEHPGMNSIAGFCSYLKFGEGGSRKDLEKSLEFKEKSFWMNTSSLSNLPYTEVLMFKGELAKAVQVCELLRPYDYDTLVLFRLGEIYYYLDDLNKSQAIWDELQSAFDDRVHSLIFKAMIAARLGRTQEALANLQKQFLLAAPNPNHYAIHDLRLASVYLGLRDKKQGFERLRAFFSLSKVREFRYIYLKYIDLDRNFDVFREDKEFQKIINGVDTWPKANASV